MNESPLMTTPYPRSFGDDFGLFFWSLGSVTAIAMFMVMICGWMSRDIWRDRYILPLSNSLTVLRFIVLLASGTSALRAMPEAVMLYSWGEVSEATMANILTVKRLADSFAIVPATLWTVLLALSYPSIALDLKTSTRNFAAAWTPWPKLVRPAFALCLVFLIAFIVASSKGTQG